MPICKKCLAEYPKEDFHKSVNHKTGIHTSCKYCRNKSLKTHKKYNPQQARKHMIQYEFNLSWEEYESFYYKQKECCAICSTPLKLHSGIDVEFPVAHVDHCHGTGKVRGLLCSACNLGIGKFKDDPSLLQKASTYLIDGKLNIT